MTDYATAHGWPPFNDPGPPLLCEHVVHTLDGTGYEVRRVIGDHSDDLRLEDAPSRNVAAAEPWWRPRHVADPPAEEPKRFPWEEPFPPPPPEEPS